MKELRWEPRLWGSPNSSLTTTVAHQSWSDWTTTQPRHRAGTNVYGTATVVDRQLISLKTLLDPVTGPDGQVAYRFNQKSFSGRRLNPTPMSLARRREGCWLCYGEEEDLGTHHSQGTQHPHLLPQADPAVAPSPPPPASSLLPWPGRAPGSQATGKAVSGRS